MVGTRVRASRAGAWYCWLGTAGFALRLGSTAVLIDPFLSRWERARPRLPLQAGDLQANCILVTHGHHDHAFDVPALAEQTQAPVFASASVCEALHDLGIPARKLRPMAAGRTWRVGEVSVVAVDARHVRFDLPLVWRAMRRSGWQVLRMLREMAGYPCGDVLGYQLSTTQGSVLHFGSAGWYRQELERLNPDVALIPLQGHSRIYDIAAQAVRLLAPRRVIPHHFDNFAPPLSEFIEVPPFAAIVRERVPGVEVVEPQIGKWAPLFR
jgi:L-ascorbate metabolism protein UlaG (beta-lactamase superfamily)